MNTSTKKAVTDCLMMQDANKLSNRLAYLLSDNMIDILANDAIAIEMTKRPTFNDIKELRSFVNDIGAELSANGVEACECNGTLDNCVINLYTDTQQIFIRYEYSWQKDYEHKSNYDYLYINIDKLKDNKEFKFETI